MLFLLMAMTSCSAPPEVPVPEISAPPAKSMAGIRVLTNDGGHLSWSKKLNKIAALIITNRPETRKRGSGIIILIDLPESF
jgi:hypothetical protein